jgi:hypothetical protein
MRCWPRLAGAVFGVVLRRLLDAGRTVVVATEAGRFDSVADTILRLPDVGRG